jgi:hypothetical protein
MTMICHANNGAAPTDARPIPGALRNMSNPTLQDMIADGWREYVPSVLPNIKSSEWVDTGAMYVQSNVVQWTQEELDQQALDAAAAAAAQDLLANGERYVAEDEYILLCDAIAGTPGAHVKLGLGDLQTALVGIIATAPARQNAIFQYLMGLQVGLQRLGGVHWWDTCTWHDQPAIVNAASERHGAIMAVLP